MLPPNTQALFDDIKQCKGIERYLLVGGTALSLQLGHRLSEDLDFLTLESLDTNHINNIIHCLEKKGRKVIDATSIELIQEFEDSGLNHEYAQRVFSVDGVKLEFFHYLPGNQFKFDYSRIQATGLEDIDCDRIRVASLDSIFYLKTLLIPTRSMHRDLFDLVSFLDSGQYRIEDIFEVARSQGFPHDVYVRQLLHRPKSEDDPGVQVSGKKTPTYEQLVKRLEKEVYNWEVRQASDRN